MKKIKVVAGAFKGEKGVFQDTYFHEGTEWAKVILTEYPVPIHVDLPVEALEVVG